MVVTSFETARAAVASGVLPEVAARELVGTMTPEERLWCLDGDAPTWAGLQFLGEDGYHKAPFLAGRIERAGVPGVAFADGPRGAVIGNATCFPVSMARGATWDPELEERVGDVVGRELRAAGATLTGAVCVNVLRHPAWGRAQETYGEDPHHVGELGAALTRGLQRHVLACVKHFACNSMENARFSVDIEVDEVALHEIYLSQFRRIVGEGVAAVMSAYNSVNGHWCGQNRTLLTDVLRGEWGFEGFVLSDWIFGLRDATASVDAGLDVEMPYRMVRARDLPGALERAEVSWSDVDAAAQRLVSTLLRFDGVLSAPDPPRQVIGSRSHRALAREVAARSAVVLRNETVDGSPVLPLEPQGLRVAVLGGLADTVNLGDSGSSDVWDLDCESILDGLRGAIEGVVYDDGRDVGHAASIAADADAAVVVVGYTYRDEGEYIGPTEPSLGELFPAADEPDVAERFEAWIGDRLPTVTPDHLAERPRGGFGLGGDRSSLRLPVADVELIRAVSAANPRTVVAVQAGSAVVVREWVDAVPAVVLAWYGGCRAGSGLADVLLGAINPSARLPFTIPLDESDLPPFERDATNFRYDRWHGWWHLARTGRRAQFPFGFGLSYTTFSLGDVEVSPSDGALVVRGAIHNTGERAGADVVQVYAELPDPDAPSRLVGFARIEVAAGGHVGFEITVPVDRLARRDPDSHRWTHATGRHRLVVARSSDDPGAHVAEVDL